MREYINIVGCKHLPLFNKNSMINLTEKPFFLLNIYKIYAEFIFNNKKKTLIL